MKKIRVLSFKKLQIVNNFIILLMICALSVLVFTMGTVSVSGASDKVIYNGNKNSKKVSLMINVYWGTEFLEGILSTLEKHNAEVTFFVGGSWADDNIHLLKKMREKHEIGNHGYFHKDHKVIDFAKNREEIGMCHKVVKEITGLNMNLFAPPSGAYDADTIKASEELGYKVIMWTRDTIDWRDKDTDLILKRATNKMSGGDLILMHPTKNTLEALPSILKYIQENGFEAVSVSKNIDMTTSV